MLLEHLREGSSAYWLPTEQIEGIGNGKLVFGKGSFIIEGVGGMYLPFVRNAINYEIFRGDTISYNFTGCIMAAFTHRGVPKVCHISTGSGQDCTEEWNRIKRESTKVMEFRPSHFIDAKGLPLDGCYGLITSKYEPYSITVCGHFRRRKVTSVVKASLSPNSK